MGRKSLLLIVFIVVLSILLFFVVKGRIPQETNSVIFKMAESTLSNASWSKPTQTTETTGIGEVTGEKITGEITTDKALVPDFSNKKELKDMGYAENSNLSADGPGSSVWGYTKTIENGDTEVILYSYTVSPTSTNPNEPISFDCPCKASVSVFTGIKKNPASGLANPASVNCAKQGGTTVIKTMGNGGQYGLCEFEDNMACEEWAMYRGECPVGGIKTTGYDNIEQMYCAWVGGKTLAVENAQCTLPDGTICSNTALYNGTCPQ